MSVQQEAFEFLKTKTDSRPKIGVVCGSGKISQRIDSSHQKFVTESKFGIGLSGLAEKITDKISISYKDIPNFPVSTVEGHKGCLVFGKLGGKDVICMQVK